EGDASNARGGPWRPTGGPAGAEGTGGEDRRRGRSAERDGDAAGERGVVQLDRGEHGVLRHVEQQDPLDAVPRVDRGEERVGVLEADRGRAGVGVEPAAL